MPAVNRNGFAAEDVSPADGAEAVTPHDTNEMTYISRALWIGGAGTMTVVTQAGETILFSGIPAGTIIPIRVKIVKATGTTATLIVALS